jgi:acetoin utilization protein AcuB
MSEQTIEPFMTHSPHTIGRDQTLATAHRLMRQFNIRHLPVLDGGTLVGMLSERDLDFVETLSDVEPESIAVTEAMSQVVYSVSPQEQLQKVSQMMADNRVGSAVVVEEGRVVGLFTTIDALRALCHLLKPGVL